jgi:hypothetical protein
MAAGSCELKGMGSLGDGREIKFTPIPPHQPVSGLMSKIVDSEVDYVKKSSIVHTRFIRVWFWHLGAPVSEGEPLFKRSVVTHICGWSGNNPGRFQRIGFGQVPGGWRYEGKAHR